MDCFQSKVNPAQESYQKILARAKEVSVFYKKQHKQTRWFKRTEPPIEVLACDDENETILRLAFLAAQNNFNALLDLEISSKKVKQMGSYQTREWRGIATPYLIETKTSTNNLNP